MVTPFRIFEAVFYSFVNLMPYLILAMYPFAGNLRFSKTVTGLLIGGLTVFQICLSVIASLYSPKNAALLSLISVVIYGAFFLAAVREPIGKLLFVLLMVSNVANLVVMSGKCFEGFFFPEMAIQDNRWTFSVASMLMQLIFLPPVFWFFKRFLKEAVLLQSSKKVWRYLWLIPLTFFLFWYHGIYFSPYSSLELALKPGNTLFTLAVNLGAMLVYYVIAKALHRLDHNLTLQNQNYNLSIQNLQYEKLKERIEETRMAKHDLRHHMNVLYSFCKNQEYDQLEEYLENYIQNTPVNWQVSYCSHFSLNAVISYYAQIAAENGIEFNAQVSVPENIPVEESDLTVLFGNLLENACQECCRIPPEKRAIRIRISLPNSGSMVFLIENPCIGELKKENDRFLSTKHSGYGTGIRSSKNIVSQYNGSISFGAEDGVFKVSGLLNF